jgi:hypothetical protein
MRRWISAPRTACGATQALPPCISATYRTIASPSPEPGSPRASGAR